MTSSKLATIAVTSPSFSKNETLLSELSKHADKLILNDSNIKFTETSVVSWLNESKAEAAIIGTEPISGSVIKQLKYLKAIGKYGVGCDNIDVHALKSAGIFFHWEGGVNKRSVSELALGFMLGHFRNVFKNIDCMQSGSWKKVGGVQVSNRNIGIVGLGHIGTDLASLLQPFGCKIYFHDVADKSDTAKKYGIEQLDYLDLLRQCDMISFHVPGGDSTHHMFADKEIAALRNNKPLIINTARGTVCDFDAVVKGVNSGLLAGYASDVFPIEPFDSSQFKIENGFYFTSHIGGNAAEAVISMGQASIRGIMRYLELRKN
ncbi:MAG: NAD(P)-binding domain-containing protein [Proteobacteria bacterium]|nr:NAD(P)-binding domain-containing protein [Pseudomonadota bacterium]